MSSSLSDVASSSRQTENELLRTLITEKGRVDLMLTQVMGLSCATHHAHMLKFRMTHRRRSLIEVFRGAGKTTCLTTAYALYLLVTKPDIRILIASKTGDNAKAMALEVRKHLESPRFIEIFGDLSTDDWGYSFTISSRTKIQKEQSVEYVGVGGSVTSRHYDVLLGDDLTDEENSRTEGGRNGLETFWYKTLDPTLMPGPDAECHVVGTRYYDQDLLGHLEQTDMAGNTLILPALLGEEGSWSSAWPEMFPVEDLLRRRMGNLPIFNTQYQLDTRLLRMGNLINYESAVWINADETTKWASVGGVDLAIKTGASNDYFAFARGRYNPITGVLAIVRCWKAKIPFKMQAQRISDEHDEEPFSKLVVESNFYQASQLDEIFEVNPDIPAVGMESKIDKTAKAITINSAIETGKLVFVKGGPGVSTFLEAICLFPKGEYDDELDAVYACRQAAVAKAKRRAPRHYEPGFATWAVKDR